MRWGEWGTVGQCQIGSLKFIIIYWGNIARQYWDEIPNVNIDLQKSIEFPISKLTVALCCI